MNGRSKDTILCGGVVLRLYSIGAGGNGINHSYAGTLSAAGFHGSDIYLDT